MFFPYGFDDDFIGQSLSFKKNISTKNLKLPSVNKNVLINSGQNMGIIQFSLIILITIYSSKFIVKKIKLEVMKNSDFKLDRVLFKKTTKNY